MGSSLPTSPRRAAGLRADDPVLLFAAAALATAVRCLYFQPVPVTRGEMDAVALTLAHQGFFGNPFPLTGATGPTAFVPPLYPLFLSLLVRLFGDQGYFLPLSAATCAIYGLHTALLPLVSERFLGTRRPGVWAAAACILAPVLLWVPHWDALATATSLMLFSLAAPRIRTAGTWPAPASRGVFAGVLALLNPSSLLVTVPIAVLAGWRNPRRLLVLPVFGAAAVLAMAPWLARNWLVLSTPALKTNFGVTLYASNNDCASPSLLASLASGCHGAHHPFGSFAETGALRALGEAAYDRSRQAAARHWIAGHRAAFLRLTLARVVEFWFPPLVYGAYAIACWLITAVGAAGLVLLRRPHRWFFGCSVAVFVLYPPLYYVVISDPRYRYPILWISLLGFGYAMERLAGTLVRPPRPLHVPAPGGVTVE